MGPKRASESVIETPADWLTPEERDQLEIAAKARGLSLDELLRQIMSDYLNRVEDAAVDDLFLDPGSPSRGLHH